MNNITVERLCNKKEAPCYGNLFKVKKCCLQFTIGLNACFCYEITLSLYYVN